MIICNEEDTKPISLNNYLNFAKILTKMAICMGFKGVFCFSGRIVSSCLSP